MSRPYKFWTNHETAKFIAAYPDTGNKDLAAIFGRTAEALALHAMKYGISKSAAFMEKKAGRFLKKQTSWNKGKSYRPAGSEKNHFNKGHVPANTKPIGSEHMDWRGNARRKVSETGSKEVDWVPIKDIIYIEHHGPVPAGHFVTHDDRDKSNFAPANLIAVTRSENARRNSNRAKAAATKIRNATPALARYLAVVAKLSEDEA